MREIHDIKFSFFITFLINLYFIENIVHSNVRKGPDLWCTSGYEQNNFMMC